MTNLKLNIFIGKIYKRLKDIDFLKCISSIILLKVLRLFFRFDKWHVNSYHCRKYKRDLVRELNLLYPKQCECVLEIGGGLGDLVGNLKSDRKILIDLDKNLKIPLKFLKKDIFFVYGSFDEALDLAEKKINILILVNWIHNVEYDVIVDFLINVVRQKNIEYILLDEIMPHVSGYKYKHDFKNALESYDTLKIINDPENIRHFRLLKCK